MKTWGKKAVTLCIVLAGTSSYTWGCPKGWVETDVPGVCQESDTSSSVKPSDEKPPEDKMPSWQRADVKVIDAPSMTASDEKADRERAEAEADGKRKAGVKS